jgi:hypothetical protein
MVAAQRGFDIDFTVEGAPESRDLDREIQLGHARPAEVDFRLLAPGSRGLGLPGGPACVSRPTWGFRVLARQLPVVLPWRCWMTILILAADPETATKAQPDARERRSRYNNQMAALAVLQAAATAFTRHPSIELEVEKPLPHLQWHVDFDRRLRRDRQNDDREGSRIL